MDNQDSRKEKVAVYIDGSNFYGYLRDKEISFPKGIKFNFRDFVNFLVGEKREFISKRYYTGVFRNFDGTEKSENLVRGQQKFFSKLINDGFTIKRGRIMPIDKVYKDKSFVKIARDGKNATEKIRKINNRGLSSPLFLFR